MISDFDKFIVLGILEDASKATEEHLIELFGLLDTEPEGITDVDYLIRSVHNISVSLITVLDNMEAGVVSLPEEVQNEDMSQIPEFLEINEDILFNLDIFYTTAQAIIDECSEIDLDYTIDLMKELRDNNGESPFVIEEGDEE